MKPRPAAAFGKSSRNVEHAQIFSGWLGNAALPFLCPDCSRAFWVCHRRVRGFRLEDVCITLMGSEMNVPRLTAEASLYPTSRRCTFVASFFEGDTPAAGLCPPDSLATLLSL